MILIASKITQRHNLLFNSIGWLKEELQSYEMVGYLVKGSLIYLGVGTLLEALFFILYNDYFHPFKAILLECTEGNIRII